MSALDGVKARLQAATPGPWAHYGDLGHEVYAVNAHDDDEPGYVAEAIPCENDAELIAHAPTDLARLVAAVEAVLAYGEDRKKATHEGGKEADAAVKSYAYHVERLITEALGGEG